MRQEFYTLLILCNILAIHPVHQAVAQENTYQVVDFVDLPSELKVSQDSSCTIEFQEQWIINAEKFSISKRVDAYRVPCANWINDISSSGERVQLKEISYEFSFLDPHQTSIQNLQKDMVQMIKNRLPDPKIYNLPEQLLSVQFHEEWILQPDNQEITKIVKGITPVIWQKRQTTDGEAIDDAETGYPVYYTLELDQISLRNP
jgi:hypothetical protein